jgi:tripartite-type tricarboxylate transporter receptor subunit TctC
MARSYYGFICGALLFGYLSALPVYAQSSVPSVAVGASESASKTETGVSGVVDDWHPDKIEMVIANAVGGGQDVTTRILGEVWSEKLGIPFIYNNKDGASGQVGYTYFLTLPEDGSALLSTNLASAAIMYKEQSPDFNWEEDLEWLGIFGIDPGDIFVLADSPFKNIQDVIEAAKLSTVTIAISYWASPENLLLQQIIEQTGAQFEIIPYNSANDLISQVLGGHIQVGFAKVSTVQKSGDALRTLAVTMGENPAPGLTNNAPAIDKALGTETLVVASYRAINVPKKLREKYPGRFRHIKETFEAAKDDPRVVEAMEKAGVKAELIVDWTPEQLNEQTQQYWDVYEKYKDIYKKAK